MKMNSERNRAKARASPVSGALCGPSTVISEQGSLYLHRHPDAVLNEQGGHRNFFSNDSTQSFGSICTYQLYTGHTKEVL
ncbi:hypothetical protein ACFX1S_012887 [Malus domestica]